MIDSHECSTEYVDDLVAELQRRIDCSELQVYGRLQGDGWDACATAS